MLPIRHGFWLDDLRADLLSCCFCGGRGKRWNWRCGIRRGFVVDGMDNSKEGGVAVDVCSSQTGLLFCSILRDIYARIHTHYVRIMPWCHTSYRLQHKTLKCLRKYRKVSGIYFFNKSPEGIIWGKFPKKMPKMYFIEGSIWCKVVASFLCFIGLKRTEHLSETERLCKGR